MRAGVASQREDMKKPKKDIGERVAMKKSGHWVDPSIKPIFEAACKPHRIPWVLFDETSNHKQSSLDNLSPLRI